MPDYTVARQFLEVKGGVLFWKDLHIPSDNNRLRGKPVGTAPNRKGYSRVRISSGGKKYEFLYHRVLYMLATGEDITNKQIDHINGDPSDNRIENLRAVTQEINQRNRKRQKSISSFTGVIERKRKAGTAYEATICNRYLGIYENLSEALEARKEAEKRLGFTDRHWGAVE